MRHTLAVYTPLFYQWRAHTLKITQITKSALAQLMHLSLLRLAAHRPTLDRPYPLSVCQVYTKARKSTEYSTCVSSTVFVLGARMYHLPNCAPFTNLFMLKVYTYGVCECVRVCVCVCVCVNGVKNNQPTIFPMNNNKEE